MHMSGFLHSLASGHWGYFLFLAITDDSVMNIRTFRPFAVLFFNDYYFWIVTQESNYPEMGLQGHRVVLLLLPGWFSSSSAILHAPNPGSAFPTPLAAVAACLFANSLPHGVSCNLSEVLFYLCVKCDNLYIFGKMYNPAFCFVLK